MTPKRKLSAEDLARVVEAVRMALDLDDKDALTVEKALLAETHDFRPAPRETLLSADAQASAAAKGLSIADQFAPPKRTGPLSTFGPRERAAAEALASLEAEYATTKPAPATFASVADAMLEAMNAINKKLGTKAISVYTDRWSRPRDGIHSLKVNMTLLARERGLFDVRVDMVKQVALVYFSKTLERHTAGDLHYFLEGFKFKSTVERPYFFAGANEEAMLYIGLPDAAEFLPALLYRIAGLDKP